jgi:hypothetical protein
VDPVPDPLLLRKPGKAGNRIRTSGFVSRNSDHWTTEAVYFLLHNIFKLISFLTGNTIHLRSKARNSDSQTTGSDNIIWNYLFVLTLSTKENRASAKETTKSTDVSRRSQLLTLAPPTLRGAQFRCTLSADTQAEANPNLAPEGQKVWQ